MAPQKNFRPRPRLQTANPYKHHPSGRGRSEGYGTEFRQMAIAAHTAHGNNNAMIMGLQGQRLWAHRTSIYRWRRRLLLLGHLRRYRRTGNRRATVLQGRQLLNLSVWRALWPRGNHHEANIWLHHAGGRLRFYQPSQISKAEDSLGLSLKRASVQARQSHLPINLQLRYQYWYLPCPFGISNIPRSRIIDLDEAALFVESSNRGRGKAHLVRRVRELGPYGHSEKLNILVAICGEDYVPGQQARRWVETWTDGGTTNAKFLRFILRILVDIGPGTPANFKVFTMDNLSSHRNVLVQQVIHAAGHVCIFRAPYYPVDSPIEHVFNTIQGALTAAMYSINLPEDVRRVFLATLRRINTFARYFGHVGINN